MEKVKGEIYKISADSNCYLIKDKGILIDTGHRRDRSYVKKQIDELIGTDNIRKVIFTHLHYDHTGNADLFPNADFYASEASMRSFDENAYGAVLSLDTLNMLRKIHLLPVKDMDGLKVFPAPGHTAGSIVILHEAEKVLFSGDTLFQRGMVGRVDLPTSKKSEMKQTLEFLATLDYDILCPGHDY